MPGRFLEIPVFLGGCFYAAPCRLERKEEAIAGCGWEP